MIALCAFLSSTFLANQATNTMAIVPNAEYCPINNAAGLESTPYIDNTFSPNRMAVRAEPAPTTALIPIEF